MKLTPLKALALEAQLSNRQSNQSLTLPERLSNFPSYFKANDEQKLDKKLGEKKNQKKSDQALYLGMSTKQIIPPQRLRYYWSILGDCVEERKDFTFRCKDLQEADELFKLTLTLVNQINDQWTIELNYLELRASPPRVLLDNISRGYCASQSFSSDTLS